MKLNHKGRIILFLGFLPFETSLQAMDVNALESNNATSSLAATITPASAAITITPDPSRNDLTTDASSAGPNSSETEITKNSSANDTEHKPTNIKNQKKIDVFTASEKGDVVTLRRLIDQNVDVKNATSDHSDEFNGWTSLQIAAYNGHVQIVQLLIAAGADPNQPVFAFAEGELTTWTPLQMAAYKGHAPVVQLLIDAGVDPEKRVSAQADNLSCWTPLHIAASANKAQVVQALINAHVNPNPKISKFKNIQNDITPLHIAVHEGNAQVVQVLMAAGINPDQGPVSSNVWVNDGMTSLQIAQKQKYDDVARLLIESGASISDTTPIDQLYQTEFNDEFANSMQELNLNTAQLEKALFMAISQGFIDSIDFIINKLVSISCTDDQASVHKKIQEIILQTMCYHSVQKNDAMLENLINRLPRDPQFMYAIGQALLAATKNNNQNATEQLLQAGAHPYWANRYIDFALSNQIDPKIKEWYQHLQNRWKLSATVITEKVHLTSFLSLLSHTACDQIASYVSTQTPAYVRLIRAFEKKDLNAIQAALSNGADPNTRNEQGIPLLWIGFANPDMRQRHLMLTLLLNRGAQANPINNNGTSLFEHIKTLSAVERGHRFEAIKKLANHTSDPDLIDEINKPEPRTLWAALGSSLH